jgi:hypothetical protein
MDGTGCSIYGTGCPTDRTGCFLGMGKGGHEIWRSISAGTRLSLNDSPCHGRTWRRDFRTGYLLLYGVVLGDGFAARMSLTWSSGGTARRKQGPQGPNEAPARKRSTGLTGRWAGPPVCLRPRDLWRRPTRAMSAPQSGQRSVSTSSFLPTCVLHRMTDIDIIR